MSNELEKRTDGIGKAVETVPEVYDDAFKPAAQESGKTIALIPRTINAALVPLRKWIAEREYNLAETEKLLAKKLEHVDKDKIITPEPYVAVPTIQAISYTMDSAQLRDLYANLLAKSMNSDTKASVHPAYLETIKQLSPDDAVYFRHICPLRFRPMVDVTLDFPKGLTITLSKNNNLFSTNQVNNFALSLDNLSRLGLIKVPDGIWYGDDSLYTTLISYLEKDYILGSYKTEYPDATGISFEKKRIDITPYGQSFYDICIS